MQKLLPTHKKPLAGSREKARQLVFRLPVWRALGGRSSAASSAQKARAGEGGRGRGRGRRLRAWSSGCLIIEIEQLVRTDGLTEAGRPPLAVPGAGESIRTARRTHM